MIFDNMIHFTHISHLDIDLIMLNGLRLSVSTVLGNKAAQDGDFATELWSAVKRSANLHHVVGIDFAGDRLLDQINR